MHSGNVSADVSQKNSQTDQLHAEQSQGVASSILSAVRVILYEPQDPVNIAATVRAMKNMGCSDLYLVRSVEYDPWRLAGRHWPGPGGIRRRQLKKGQNP